MKLDTGCLIWPTVKSTECLKNVTQCAQMVKQHLRKWRSMFLMSKTWGAVSIFKEISLILLRVWRQTTSIGNRNKGDIKGTMDSQVARWQRTHLPQEEMQETWVWSLGQKDCLEQEIASHSSRYSCLEN